MEGGKKSAVFFMWEIEREREREKRERDSLGDNIQSRTNEEHADHGE